MSQLTPERPLQPDELEFSQREIDDAKRQIAQEYWDEMDEHAQDWLQDACGGYIVDLARGGDSANAARRRMERDCVADMASYVPTYLAIRRLR